MMRLIIAACAMLLMQSPSAYAQTTPPGPARWTDPEGVWSLDFAANDWVIPDYDPRQLPDRTLVIVPRVSPSDREGVTTCSAIQAHPQIDPGVDIAHFANSLDAQSAAGLIRRPVSAVSAVTHATVNGVAVADVVIEDRGGRDLYRVFLAPAGGTGLLVVLDCARTNGANPNNIAAQDRILASLQINAQTSSAQPGVWTDPSGRFTLAFADLGWSGPPVPETADGYVLAVGNSALGVGGGRPAVCAVRHSPSARVSPTTSPERVNGLTDGLDESALQRLHHTNVPMENLTRLEIDGVHVIDYISRANGAWQHWRTFWLLQGDQVFMYDVACTAAPPISAEASANMEAVLQTLHFLPPRTSK